MPQLNRRRFLQAVSAAGLVPMIPALPVSAAAAPAGATSAQMLWASLYARAGNAQNAAGLARAMGIPMKSAQGIYAKLVQSNIVAANGATSLGHVARSRPSVLATPKPVESRTIKFDLEKLIDEEVEADDQEDVEDAVSTDDTLK